MVEVFINGEQQYQEICKELGIDLIVVKKQPISNNLVDDISRYEFQLKINNYACKFIIINNIKTLIIIENLAITKFSFYAIKASLFGPIFQPSLHLKIGRNTIKFDGSNKELTQTLATEEVLSGFLTMTKNLNIVTTQYKSNEDILDIINPNLQITLFSTPSNTAMVKAVIHSISIMLEKIL